jgi:splicing factor 3A subunit 1
LTNRDIIKLTAQFVARNGQRFLNGLSEREAKNSQYDFLKPNHHLFGYFTNLVDSYSKCLLPRKDEIAKLQSFANDRFAILKKASERHFWEKRQRENQKKKDDNDELEKTQLAGIDWYDFTIVEVIDFNDMDTQQNYPQNSMVANGDMDVEITKIPIDMNNEMQNKQTSRKIKDEKDDIQMNNFQRTEDVITNEDLPEPNMKIVKNFTRRPEANKGDQQSQKCPKCGEMIPLNEWSEHLKIEMIDPKWREKKLELMEINQSTIITEDNEMKKHLTKLTQKRPDLFGDVNDEMIMEEHKKAENKGQIKWDGYAPNMSRTTANIAMLAQQQKKNFEDLKKTQDPTNIISTT